MNSDRLCGMTPREYREWEKLQRGDYDAISRAMNRLALFCVVVIFYAAMTGQLG